MSERPQISPENWPWKQPPIQDEASFQLHYNTHGFSALKDYGVEVERLTTWLQMPTEKRGDLNLEYSDLLGAWYYMKEELRTAQNLNFIRGKLYYADWHVMLKSLPFTELTVPKLKQIGVEGVEAENYIYYAWNKLPENKLTIPACLCNLMGTGLKGDALKGLWNKLPTHSLYTNQRFFLRLYRMNLLIQEDFAELCRSVLGESMISRIAKAVEASRNQPESPTRNSDNEMAH